MSVHDPERLKSLLAALNAQDSIILSSITSRGFPQVQMEQNRTIAKLFRLIDEYIPDLVPVYNEHGNAATVRSQLSLACNRLQDTIDQLSTSMPQVLHVPEASDKRRVFVVHGRNLQAKNAMFSLLRAIDLDPIEWEEAIQMTAESSPYNGHVLDMAFANAQAAVVLLTGDDMARLGTKYVTDHEDEFEKHLTKQARPNVLFEMGMAFGKYPDRTVIVEFGKTRWFTDTLGRNTVRFSNNAEFRKKIADRLKTAKCLVRTDNRSDWLSAGDFSSVLDSPDNAGTDKETDDLKRQITALKQTIETLEVEAGRKDKKAKDLAIERDQSAKRLTRLEDELKTQLAKVDSYQRETKTLADELLAEKNSDERKVLTIKSNRLEELLKSKDAELTAKQKLLQDTANALTASEEDRLKKERRIKQLEGDKAPRTLPPSPSGINAPGDEFVGESPDGYKITIKRLASGDQKGLMLTVHNHQRLDPIGECHIEVFTARSFDNTLQGYRDGRKFQPLGVTTEQVIHGGESGFGFWIIRKHSANVALFVGNLQSYRSLEWPKDDATPFHRWRLTFKVSAKTTPEDKSFKPADLTPITGDLVFVYDLHTNEFTIEEPITLHN